MRILYLIFVLCVGALLWAAFAAARHIRRHESKMAPLPEEKSTSPDGLPEERELLVIAEKSRSD
jgi:hypothetical protein